jgi:hypothetical protein
VNRLQALRRVHRGSGATVPETVSAGRPKCHAADLTTLFDGAARILVGKGKSHVAFDPASDGAEEIASKVLGRSGTLRAPAARVGNAWVVGFTDDMRSEIVR